MSENEVVDIDMSWYKPDIMLPACISILNKGFVTMEKMTKRIPETEKEIQELTEKLADSKAKLEWLKSMNEDKVKEIREAYDDGIKQTIAKLREDGRDSEAKMLEDGLDEPIIL